MAFASTTVWEIRDTGNSANGGSFNSAASGSDYSQSDTPEHTFTDMVIDGAVNTRFTSALRPAVDADVGNAINVTSGTGFTVQRVQITSVSSGAYNVDKSLGTLGSTGGNGRLGGAITSLATALAAGAGQNTFYMKGSFTTGSAITGGSAGVGNIPNRIIGYETTRGDDGLATITATASFTTLLNPSGDHWLIENLKLDCDGTVNNAYQPASTGLTIHMRNCWAVNWTRAGFHGNTSNEFVCVDCRASDGTGGGDFASQHCAGFAGRGFCTFIRCKTYDSDSNGFVSADGGSNFVDCIAWDLRAESGDGGHGCYVFGSTGIKLVGCTFANCEGSGVYNPNASATAFADFEVDNCIFSDIDRYAFESTTVAMTNARLGQKMRNNAFYNVTLGNQSNWVAGTNEIALTASPFRDLATGDLRLNNTTGGGALLRQAGAANSLPWLTSTSVSRDVGALQANDGGTGHQEMVSLWREWTGEFSTTRIPEAAVNKYLQSGLEEFNNVTGYSYADDTDTTLVAGTQEYDIPEDALEVVWVEHNSQRLKKGDVEEWESKGVDWRNEAATTPKFWAIYGNKIVLRAKPDAAAVAASSTLTIRYIRSPRDIGTYGPEQLAPAHYRAVVRYAVYEFSAAHPDSATAETRRGEFKEMFDNGAAAAAEFYRRRRLERGAPSEVTLASGTKRK